MSIYRYFSCALLFVNLLFCTLSVFAEDCKVEKVEDSPITERTRRVKFPDGREITVVGQNHGDRDVTAKIQRIAYSDLIELDNASFLKQIHSLLEEYKTSIVGAKEDELFLKKTIKENPRIGFIGIEGTDRILQILIKNYEKIRLALHKQFKQRNLPLDKLYKELLLLPCGAGCYLLSTEPGLFKTAKLQGFESLEAVNANAESLQKKDSLLAILRRETNTNNEFKELVDKALSKFIVADLVGESSVPKEEILPLTSKLPFKNQKLVLEWVESENKVIEDTRKRDAFVANAMVNTNKSGVIFVGGLHMEAIAKMVAVSCKSKSPIDYTSASTTAK